mmetsp:Transcript_22636/g.10913  ORF Transcript_22636/g.10913 Transcript_22636/m.10913 type:complete len:206 (-) Transcript_22636:2051-2668(-)
MSSQNLKVSNDKSLKIVVGLGNPGEKYKHTRHNAGFDILDAVADAYFISIIKKKFDIVYGIGSIEDSKIILAKPMTFMNSSGVSVLNLAKYFGITRRELFIIHDDVDICFGKIKIKEKGGHGGHNGVKSLINALGGDDFSRLRFGIGRPAEGKAVTEHVLSRYNSAERKEIDQLIDSAKDAVVLTIYKGLKESMNSFNNAKILIS